MAKDANRLEFKTYEEYMKYYSAQPEKPDTAKASEYYRIGENIARMASEEVIKRTINGQHSGIA
jgi:hypothetical protein